MNDKYILNDDRTPVPCSALIEWGRWMQTANRRVAEKYVGEVRISTVFLGLNHQYGLGAPLLFETMIFGGPHDGYQDRCTFWDQAETMHAAAVALARGGESAGSQPKH